jgi:hypothetical protein
MNSKASGIATVGVSRVIKLSAGPVTTETAAQEFSGATTSGSGFGARVEATRWEGVKYEIGGMIAHYQQRMIVICDMHGRDLREVLTTSDSGVSYNDGRQVMHSAIRCDMSKLSEYICDRLVESGVSSEKLEEIRVSMKKIVARCQDNLLGVASMKKDELVRVLGNRGMAQAKDYIPILLRKSGLPMTSDNALRYMGRAVMREAIFSQLNAMNRDVQYKLDQIWPLTD